MRIHIRRASRIIHLIAQVFTTSEGKPRINVVTEEEVLEQFERNPATRVKTVSDEIRVPKSII